jgi:hypothetical protein
MRSVFLKTAAHAGVMVDVRAILRGEVADGAAIGLATAARQAAARFALSILIGEPALHLFAVEIQACKQTRSF